MSIPLYLQGRALENLITYGSIIRRPKQGDYRMFDIKECDAWKPRHWTMIIESLSENGWKWNSKSRTWEKGEHGISDEALTDTINAHPSAIPWLLRAIEKGANGWKAETEKDDEHYIITLTVIK